MTEESKVPGLITLFGEEIQLLPLKGRRGAKTLQQIQSVYARILSMEGAAEAAKNAGGGFDEAVQAVQLKSIAAEFTIVNEVFLDDNFLSDTLPLLYIHSDLGIGKKAALERIDGATFSTQTVGEIADALQGAMEFWSKPEDKEAFDEAAKKSQEAGAEEA